jgi:hypothetical protein
MQKWKNYKGAIPDLEDSSELQEALLLLYSTTRLLLYS